MRLSQMGDEVVEVVCGALRVQGMLLGWWGCFRGKKTVSSIQRLALRK